MIPAIIIISLAFYWLLHETYWLTIRLPIGMKKLYHPKTMTETMAEVIPIVFAAVIILGLLKSLMPKGAKEMQKEKQRWYHIFRKFLPLKPTG